MLYLLRQADEAEAGRERLVPIADRTAVAFERALLAPNRTAAQRELVATLVADPALAVWTSRTARQQQAVEPKTAAEAGAWLTEGLAKKLSAKIHGMPPNAVSRVEAGNSHHHATMLASVLYQAGVMEAPASGATFPTKLAESETYFSRILAAANALLTAWPEALAEGRQEAMTPVSSSDSLTRTKPSAILPLTAYFLAEERGIDWRLPSLVAKLTAHEEQLADFERRLEQEKLESLKELAYGASHEINNPLANIAARAQTLLAEETEPERQRKLAAIHRQAMRAHEMIADLMLFARPPKLELAPCDLRQIVERVVAELRDEAAERKIQIESDLGSGPLQIEADETQLAVAIRAVLTNAVEAVGAGGNVWVSVRESDHAMKGEPSLATVAVRDDGPGISDEVRRHLFDPFFSGREAGRGLGFGLSKCWRIVTDHGGQVVVNQVAGCGAEVSILLPASPMGIARQ